MDDVLSAVISGTSGPTAVLFVVVVVFWIRMKNVSDVMISVRPDIDVKLCIELYLFIPLPVTLTIFQGINNVEQF